MKIVITSPEVEADDIATWLGMGVVSHTAYLMYLTDWSRACQFYLECECSWPAGKVAICEPRLEIEMAETFDLDAARYGWGGTRVGRAWDAAVAAGHIVVRG